MNVANTKLSAEACARYADAFRDLGLTAAEVRELAPLADAMDGRGA